VGALIAGSHDEVATVKNVFRFQFDVHDLGEAKYFVDFKIVRDRSNVKLWLGQP
jgi:hypothetical protein